MRVQLALSLDACRFPYALCHVDIPSMVPGACGLEWQANRLRHRGHQSRRKAGEDGKVPLRHVYQGLCYEAQVLPGAPGTHTIYFEYDVYVKCSNLSFLERWNTSPRFP